MWLEIIFFLHKKLSLILLKPNHNIIVFLLNICCFPFIQVQVATQTQSSVVASHGNAAQVQTPRGVNQFCPTLSTMAAAVDVGLGGVCALTPQQQQQQQQLQQTQQQLSHPIDRQHLVATGYAVGALAMGQDQTQLQVPAPLSAALNQITGNGAVAPPQASTSSVSSKMPGGIAKKVIDKQSRKERNRYSLLRSAAGSQGKLYFIYLLGRQSIPLTKRVKDILKMRSQEIDLHNNITYPLIQLYLFYQQHYFLFYSYILFLQFPI